MISHNIFSLVCMKVQLVKFLMVAKLPLLHKTLNIMAANISGFILSFSQAKLDNSATLFAS